MHEFFIQYDYVSKTIKTTARHGEILVIHPQKGCSSYIPILKFTKIEITFNKKLISQVMNNNF